MFGDEHEEDVEEEEEFHDIVEDKLKSTSQESMGNKQAHSHNGDDVVTGSSASSSSTASPSISSPAKKSTTESKACDKQAARSSESVAADCAKPDPLNEVLKEETITTSLPPQETAESEPVKATPEEKLHAESESVSSPTKTVDSDLPDQPQAGENSDKLELVNQPDVPVEVVNEKVTETALNKSDGPTSEIQPDIVEASKSIEALAEDLSTEVQSKLNLTDDPKINDEVAQEPVESPKATGALEASQDPDLEEQKILPETESSKLVEQEAVRESSIKDDNVDASKDIVADAEEASGGVKSPDSKEPDWVDMMLNPAKSVSSVQDDEENQGDGEQKADNASKDLDPAEDVKAPQYIPKKGQFYLHDDRSNDQEAKKDETSSMPKKDDSSTANKERPAASGRKPNAQDRPNESGRRGNRRGQRSETDRWSHDLFRDENQKPRNRPDGPYSPRSSRNNGRNNRNQYAGERPQGNQENQRPRQARDNRNNNRSDQPEKRTGERQMRRPNDRDRSRVDSNPSQGPKFNDFSRPPRSDSGDAARQNSRDSGRPANQTGVAGRRGNREFNNRDRDRLAPNDLRRLIRHDSKDKPVTERPSEADKLPPINTVMPPMTTWSNKIDEMAKEDAVRVQNNQQRHHSGNRRYQDREDGRLHRPIQFLNRNQYGDRYNSHQHQFYQHHSNHHQAHSQQTNQQRQNQQPMNQPHQHQTHQAQPTAQQNPGQSQHVAPGQQQQQSQTQQNPQQMQTLNNHKLQQSHQQQQQPQQPTSQQQPQASHAPQQRHPQMQMQQHSQHQMQQNQPYHQQHHQDRRRNNNYGPFSKSSDHQPIKTQTFENSNRVTANASVGGDSANSRPIVKTDSTSVTSSHHSNGHRSVNLSGTASHQQPSTVSSSHLNPTTSTPGAAAQYYSPSNSSRDSAAVAAALAGAYHGYGVSGGHNVMNSGAYHMTPQQISDHGYMAAPNQSNDPNASSVLHQPRLYTAADAASAAGGTVASSAYLSQSGTTLSSSNIPVTGTSGPPLAPVSYLQHSQYGPPPPYTNPYSQPQQNQGPPQSTPTYPYWTPYI